MQATDQNLVNISVVDSWLIGAICQTGNELKIIERDNLILISVEKESDSAFHLALCPVYPTGRQCRRTYVRRFQIPDDSPYHFVMTGTTGSWPSGPRREGKVASRYMKIDRRRAKAEGFNMDVSLNRTGLGRCPRRHKTIPFPPLARHWWSSFQLMKGYDS